MYLDPILYKQGHGHTTLVCFSDDPGSGGGGGDSCLWLSSVTSYTPGMSKHMRHPEQSQTVAQTLAKLVMARFMKLPLATSEAPTTPSTSVRSQKHGKCISKAYDARSKPSLLRTPTWIHGSNNPRTSNEDLQPRMINKTLSVQTSGGTGEDYVLSTLFLRNLLGSTRPRGVSLCP